jgi:hypothetical protein
MKHSTFDTQRSGSNCLSAVACGLFSPFMPASLTAGVNTVWTDTFSLEPNGSVYHICFDHYADSKYYEGIQSTDMEHNQDIFASTSPLKCSRQGTAWRVPVAAINPLSSPNNSSITET